MAADAGAIDTEALAVPLRGNRLLIVTSEGESGENLSRLLAEMYGAQVTTKAMGDYDPFIDEYYYDGFVYLGSDYYAHPKQGFLDDMAHTEKPVLWVNYHVWLLDAGFLKSKGIEIRDEHLPSLNRVVLHRTITRAPTDATLVKSSRDAVLYWLEGSGHERIPGAVHSGNFTYVSYLPHMDLFAVDFGPFLAAIRAAFGARKPPRTPKAPDYERRVEKARLDSFRTGIHLPVYVAETTDKVPGYDSDLWHANLMRIKESGAEWVDLVRTFYQKDLHASTVYADSKLTPTLKSLGNIVADAHRLGLLVRLHIAINLVERGPLEWHGMIRPNDAQKWWNSFDAAVRETAAFARRHEVESIMLGTEFTSMQEDGDRWRELIRMVREDIRYKGLTGYGVNYNSPNVQWLDALDFFSISAYWPLSERRDPDLKTLMESWRIIDKKLRWWKKSHAAISLELGEVGYVSQPYASVLPFSWKANKGQQQSMAEQLSCYESLRRFLAQAEYIGGVHIFASTAEDDQAGSVGYTPFGKPAERVVEEIFKLRRRRG